MNEENIREIYIRALENLAERIDTVRINDNEIRLNHFIRRDLIKNEAEISRMIQEWREENYPAITNTNMLHAALELYKKDLQETGEIDRHWNEKGLRSGPLRFVEMSYTNDCRSSIVSKRLLSSKTSLEDNRPAATLA
jgi:hypothetical protein